LVLSASNTTRSGVEETMLIQITTDSKIGGEKILYSIKGKKEKEKKNIPCHFAVICQKSKHIFIEEKNTFCIIVDMI